MRRSSPHLTYEELLVEIRGLDAVQQLRLLEELAATVRQRITNRREHSILELRGLGKRIWQDLDAQEYVDRERDAWSG